jgi:hypothetical protein
VRLEAIRKIRFSLCALTAAALAGACSVDELGKIPCNDSSQCPSDYPSCATNGYCVLAAPPAKIVLFAGDTQSGTVHTPLANPLVVVVEDANGNAVPAFTVTWTAAGSGQVSSGSTATGPDGKAQITATLGTAAGATTFTATGAGLTPVTFSATGLAGAAASFGVQLAATSFGAHTPQSATITALDAFSNVTSYSGTVNVSSGKLDGTLFSGHINVTPTTPATVSVTFLSATTGQSLIVTDSTTSSLTGRLNGLTVLPGVSQTTLAAGAATSVFGQPVTFTATVTGVPSGTPTGTVTLFDGTATIGTATLNGSGQAQFSVSTLAVGAHANITASYAGDTNFGGSNSTAVAESVAKAATTVSVSNPVTPSVFGQSVTFTATVSVTAPGGGSPTGSVSFTLDGNSVASCAAQTVSGAAATCTLSSLTVGTHSVRATYGGDSSFTASPTSGAFSQTVGKADSTTAISPTATSVFGQSVTFTATVTAAAPGAGSPTGTVAFKDNGTNITGCGSQTVSNAGVATCTTATLGASASAHPITAVYGGDGNFNTSTGSASQTVGKASVTVTSLTPNPATPVAGQSVTFTVVLAVTPPGAGTPTGTFTLGDAFGGGSNTSCSLPSCAASLNAGTHSFTATYDGDSNFKPSPTSAAVPVVVTKANTTVAVGADLNPVALGVTVTFTATVSVTGSGSGTPTGTVDFKDGGTLIGTCTGQTVSSGAATCALSTLTPGPHAISATYNGDANFNTSSTTSNLSEVIGPQISFNVTQPLPAGSDVSFSVTLTGSGTTAPTGTVTFSLQGAGTVTTCTLPASATSSATCSASKHQGTGQTTYVATYPGDSQYGPATSAPQSIDVTIVPPPAPTIVIVGGKLDGKVFIAGSADGSSSTATSIVDPATSAMTAGPALTVARAAHTATAIGGGQVLVAGGNASGAAFELCTFGAQSSCAPAGASIQRCNASAALVSGSRVLVAGGDDCAGAALSSWDLWSASGVISSAAANALVEPRSFATATALPDGRVLLAGGGTSSAELFDPSTLTTALLPSMSAVRTGHTASLLSAGSKACASGSCVFIAGGVSDASARSWEVFDVERAGFGRASGAPELLSPLRARHAAAVLADGRVLIAGGTAGNQALLVTEVFDGARFTPGPALQNARFGTSAAYVPALDLLLLSGSTRTPELLAVP